MKKILLTLTLACAFIGANAQCTPDPQYILAGIYPDSATGVPNALVGQAYNEVITVIVAPDTLVPHPLIPGQMLLVDIVDMTLDSVNGLPANFTYDCLAPNCAFAGGSTSCAVLSSTINPTVADIGLYPIDMYITAQIDAGVFGIVFEPLVIDYYYIEVSNVTSVVNQFNVLTFQMKDIYPNPVNNQSKIQFITGEQKDIVFFIYNYLGEKMDEQIIAATRGVNNIFINANNYPNGMYLYSINNGKKMISKRMVIAN